MVRKHKALNDPEVMEELEKRKSCIPVEQVNPNRPPVLKEPEEY